MQANEVVSAATARRIGAKGRELGRAAGRTFAGFVPAYTVLKFRAEIAVCGQRFVEYGEPITQEMVCERDQFIAAFLKICRPTPTIVRNGQALVAQTAKKSAAKASHKAASGKAPRKGKKS